VAKSAPMGFFMRNIIKSFLSDESGAAAAEYALILAIIGAGIATAAIALGNSISTALHTAATAISSYTY
jgi:pilus assembly protein Flp/PilA